ncbi:hypothetical protein EI067_19675 [Mycobacterium paragordonae]|uniref:patatin-like phospholipase family protein n=1 Tax=Mycobacterium paragordonae TaxID=1389713 RepID=UPI0010604624|nr:patatin-like phospholipase family protein [Mycobacterium paragordonae]TDK94326.1 hypothetical protein EI067_19675 [Mycobacterium paragordonae]
MSGATPLAVVYGGGGPLATAFGMGVADALTAGGIRMAEVPVLGTSGGAVAAAAVRASLSYDQVAEVLSRVRLPERQPGHLRVLGEELFGHHHDPLLWTSVVRLKTGRRTRLSGRDFPVPAIVAASCAVPLLASPERIGGYRYIDGGARSWVSADMAPHADHLIVIAPILTPAFGRFGGLLKTHLGVELRRWNRRSGGRISVIRVSEDIACRVRRWADLFDRRLATEAHAHAKHHTAQELSPGGRLHDVLHR